MNVVSNSHCGGFDQPRNWSAVLSQPSSPSMAFQTSTLATKGTTYGMKSRVRITAEPSR